MANQNRTSPNQSSDPAITWRGSFSLVQREAMIREAAFKRYAQRGYTHGHDIEDWLAAETELDTGLSAPQPGEPAEYALESGAQQSGAHGPREDDALKRAIKQHPQKAIPQVEGIEPDQAPSKE